MRNHDDDKFEDDPNLSLEDKEILAKIIEYSRNHLSEGDLENETDYNDAGKSVKYPVISENKRNKLSRNRLRKERINDAKVIEEIKKIEQELENSNIDAITAEWVRGWDIKNASNSATDPETRKTQDFITDSLKSVENEPVKDNIHRSRKVRSVSLQRFATIAAVLIGVVLLVRSLLPSSDPERIFKSFYEPLKVISSVTRNTSANIPAGYPDAIEAYRLGNYTLAEAGFSEAITKDTSDIASRFYMGLTQMALGNFDRTINLLGSIAYRPAEFNKEALWYLGLAYLKTGENEKAEKCFEALAKTKGFYSAPSLKVLRRLK